jgi:hypothetical protein
MLILILELSQASDHHLQLVQKSEFKILKETKLPSPSSILESIFHQRRFFRPSYLSIQLSLATGLYRQESFAAPMFLILASASNLNGNDRKASCFLSVVYLGSIFEPNLFPSSKNSICFWISVKNFATCCLAMAIVVALFIGARSAII